MRLLRLTPMIWTDHFQETIDFYISELNFICGDRNDTWGWAAMSHGEIDLMIATPNEHTPFDKPVFTGSFYFQIDDVESLWLKLRNRARIAYPIDTFEWGMREFAIYDNNGYLLQFGQDLEENGRL